MQKSLVRLSLPLFLLLEVLLAAALMLAADHSPATKEAVTPSHNGMIRPEFMQAGPSQNGLAKPTFMQAGPAHNGMIKPVIVQAGPSQNGFAKPTAGAFNRPLTIPFVAAGTPFPTGPRLESPFRGRPGPSQSGGLRRGSE